MVGNITFFMIFAIFTARRYACVVFAIVVCRSVTLRYCIITAKHRITQIILHDRQWTLVF